MNAIEFSFGCVSDSETETCPYRGYRNARFSFIANRYSNEKNYFDVLVRGAEHNRIHCYSFVQYLSLIFLQYTRFHNFVGK